MPSNFIFIDYENVQPRSLTELSGTHFTVLLFVGANQTKLPFEIVDAMQGLGDRARYIKSSGHGSNALDFHIAFYLGELADKERGACFHIISKDGGFDPLIQHLKSRGINARRSKSLEDISPPRAVISKSGTVEPVAERMATVVAKLRQMGSSKPRKLTTLSSTVASFFQKQLVKGELDELLEALQKQGIVVVTGTKVTYVLPEGGA